MTAASRPAMVPEFIFTWPLSVMGGIHQHRRCFLGKEFVLETVYVDYVALQAYVAAETVGIHHILHIARGLQR